jgi:glycosyltransferase involved in cell wall biosynthesis
MEDPKVLQVLPELNQGGVERGTIDIARALKAEKLDNYVCSHGGVLVKELEKISVPHFKLPVHSKNPITIIRNIFRIKDIIKKYNINIVHARSRAPGWSAYLACQLTGCKFVTTFHGVYSGDHALKRWYNSVLLRGERVIAVSNYVVKHIETRYRIGLNRIKVIYRGVDLKYFNPKKVTKERIEKIREEIGLGDFSGKVILITARISRKKGHMYMLNALKYLNNVKYKFVIVGLATNQHLQYVKELEQAIESFGLKDKVLMHAPVSDVPALYSIADVVVSPKSEPEAFGRTIIEAQAMNKIVVATKMGAPVEIIEKGKTGFLVSQNDPSAMTEVLKKIFKMDNKKIKEITKAAHDKLLLNYTLDHMCSQTIATYRELLAESY